MPEMLLSWGGMVLEPIASYNGVVGIYVTKHDQTCLRTLESDQLDQNCELCASISGTSQYTGDATVILRKRFALKNGWGASMVRIKSGFRNLIRYGVS